MRSCKHLQHVACGREGARRKDDCIICLAASLMVNSDILLSSVQSASLPLFDSHKAILAVNSMMATKAAMFSLLHADFEKSARQFMVPEMQIHGVI